MATAGEKQEQYLFQYLRNVRHCVQVIEGDQNVRDFLKAKGMPKCADALGLHQAANFPGPKRVTVAESKGDDIGRAAVQIGNAAAGVLAEFGVATSLDLLILVPKIVGARDGGLSPGSGYLAAPLKTGRQKFSLLEQSEGGWQSPIRPVRPKVLDVPDEWKKWSDRVSLLPITVLVMNG
jgi:hypothetical protein